MTKIFFDGSSSPHKHDGAGWAFLVESQETSRSYCGRLPDDYTNNQAEFFAFFRALDYAITLKSEVKVLGDSKLVIDWYNGDYHIKDKKLLNIIRNNFDFIIKNGIEVNWIPRKENKADYFAKLAKEQ